MTIDSPTRGSIQRVILRNCPGSMGLANFSPSTTINATPAKISNSKISSVSTLSIAAPLPA